MISATNASTFVRPNAAPTWIELVPLILIGGTIAALAPFDVVFNEVTAGSAPLRVCTLWTMVILGCTRRLADRTYHPIS